MNDNAYHKDFVIKQYKEKEENVSRNYKKSMLNKKQKLRKGKIKALSRLTIIFFE